MEILRNLTVNFGDKCILKNVTIESDKNIIHIIGPNGVGKTTLCNAIIGKTPFQGECCVEADNVGIMTDKMRIPSELQVKDVLDCINYDYNDAIFKSIFDKDFIKKKVGQLSSGQERLLSLCVVFYSNKKVIILDEITNSLDQTNRERILSLVDEISTTTKIIYITHNLQEIFKLKGDLFFYQDCTFVKDKCTNYKELCDMYLDKYGAIDV